METGRSPFTVANAITCCHRFHHLHIIVLFPTFSYNFLNQYQACLYLFKYISHGHSKYGHQISQCWHILNLLSAHDCRVERVDSRRCEALYTKVNGECFHDREETIDWVLLRIRDPSASNSVAKSLELQYYSTLVAAVRTVKIVVNIYVQNIFI